MMTPHEFGVDTLADPHGRGKTSGVLERQRDVTKGYCTISDEVLEARASEFARSFSVTSGYKMTLANLVEMTAGYVSGYRCTAGFPHSVTG
jgi:hypothetical protein